MDNEKLFGPTVFLSLINPGGFAMRILGRFMSSPFGVPHQPRRVRNGSSSVRWVARLWSLINPGGFATRPG